MNNINNYENINPLGSSPAYVECLVSVEEDGDSKFKLRGIEALWRYCDLPINDEAGEICQFTCLTDLKMRQHTMEKHTKPRTSIKCSLCNKYLSKAAYRRHVREHHLKVKKECKTCGEKFTGSNYSKHRVTHSEVIEMTCPVPCPSLKFERGNLVPNLCEGGKKWKKTSYEAHISPPSFICQFCSKLTKTRQHMDDHLYNHHDGERGQLKTSYENIWNMYAKTCRNCGEWYSHPKMFWAHLLRCEDRMICTKDDCEGEFIIKGYMWHRHQKIHKEQEKAKKRSQKE